VTSTTANIQTPQRHCLHSRIKVRLVHSSWDVIKEFLKIMFDVDHKEPTISDLIDAGGRNKKFLRIEQCLITLMWFQNLFEHEYLASIFGCHCNVISVIIKCWAPHFHEVGCHMDAPEAVVVLNFSSYHPYISRHRRRQN
jgi:hypothetical protein